MLRKIFFREVLFVKDERHGNNRDEAAHHMQERLRPAITEEDERQSSDVSVDCKTLCATDLELGNSLKLELVTFSLQLKSTSLQVQPLFSVPFHCDHEKDLICHVPQIHHQ